LAELIRPLDREGLVLCSVIVLLTLVCPDQEFAPAALVDDVSSAPSPGGMKQIVSEPFAGKELSPLAPLFALQTLFKQVGSNHFQLVFSGGSILIPALKAEHFHSEFFFKTQNGLFPFSFSNFSKNFKPTSFVVSVGFHAGRALEGQVVKEWESTTPHPGSHKVFRGRAASSRFECRAAS
jgi:hypothetical protein